MALTLAQIESRVDTEGRRPWWSFLRRHPLLVIGGALLAIMALVALAAPWIAPYNPIDMNVLQRLKAPSEAHPFGTDALGRDVFSRVLWGGRMSLIVGSACRCSATGFGVLIGMVAGYLAAGGRGDHARDGRADGDPGILLAVRDGAMRGPHQDGADRDHGPEIPRVVRLVRSLVW